MPGFEDIIKKQKDNSYSGGDWTEIKKDTKPPAAATTTETLDVKQRVAQLTERVKKMHETLSGEVLGQENAISVFCEGYFQAELREIIGAKHEGPKASFLFAGPPGVGKTLLAKTVSRKDLLDLPFKRFDMSEYCDKESSLEFIGSDAVYKSSSKGNFTSFVEENPKCVLLLDEIEKAHISIIHLFLQVLDAGFIRDSKTDKEIPLNEAILIFTTNAGKQLYEEAENGDFSEISRKVVLKALRDDVNPQTKEPFFPAAMCSRFASGNVVMFNHIPPHLLRTIARNTIVKNSEALSEKMGVKIDVDEQVYTALLLSEGGSSDARTINSRAEAFFNGEMFELFRLLSSKNGGSGIGMLNSIKIKADLDSADSEIRSLFVGEEKHIVAVISTKAISDQCMKHCPNISFINVASLDEAKKVFCDNEISFAAVDPSFGIKSKVRYLNIEDMDSTARDIFWFVRNNYPGIPAYLLQSAGSELSPDERVSYLRQGVRGFIMLDRSGKAFSDSVREATEMIHQQNSIIKLARANKVLGFETSQLIENNGKTATITMFDFEQIVAVDAEDADSIMNNRSKPKVGFDEVIGAEDAKDELKYFIDYLKNPKRFVNTGMRPPRGVLLYGPPGTGKTMLAKAMATASDATFIAVEGNQFQKSLHGESPQTVHKLFAMARKYAPAILFVDEIDAIAKERRGGELSAVDEATLTAFLAEMDGIKTDFTKPVFVLAATNFDVTPGGPKSLDPALMRRFDRTVKIDLPTMDERVRFLRMKLAKNKAFSAITEDAILNIANRSVGMSLADLESVLELSLRMTVRAGEVHVTNAILDDSLEIFTSGESREKKPEYLLRTARHESGHTLLCWLSGEKPAYVTVVARADHGGYMRHGNSEDKPVRTREDLIGRIRTSLAGRAAEIVCYGEKDGLSSGASADLENATVIAMHMLCSFGMDEKFGLATVDINTAMNGGELSKEIRAEVNQILKTELEYAIEAIKANRAKFDRLVEELVRKNRLDEKEIEEILK